MCGRFLVVRVTGKANECGRVKGVITITTTNWAKHRPTTKQALVERTNANEIWKLKEMHDVSVKSNQSTGSVVGRLHS